MKFIFKVGEKGEMGSAKDLAFVHLPLQGGRWGGVACDTGDGSLSRPSGPSALQCCLQPGRGTGDFAAGEKLCKRHPPAGCGELRSLQTREGPVSSPSRAQGSPSRQTQTPLFGSGCKLSPVGKSSPPSNLALLLPCRRPQHLPETPPRPPHWFPLLHVPF